MESILDNPMQLLVYSGNIILFVAIIVFLAYLVQVQEFSTRSKKYKLVSEKESKFLMGTAVLLSISMGIYAFVLTAISIELTGVFSYALSVTIALVVGFGLGYVLRSYLRYYHPFILEKRLHDIRFKPMISPITGKPMQLLNESQEDIHLTQKMIEEEEAHTVDYDVWLDKESDYKIIERYDTRFHHLICDKCNLRTLTEKMEEMIIVPQQHSKGLLKKYYECSYCGHIETKEIELPSWDEEAQYEGAETDIIEDSEFGVIMKEETV